MPHDLLSDLERLRMAATWRGVVLARRGGAARALLELTPAEVNALGRAIRAQVPGRYVMVHARGCRSKNDRCRCAGARLECGASA